MNLGSHQPDLPHLQVATEKWRQVRPDGERGDLHARTAVGGLEPHGGDGQGEPLQDGEVHLAQFDLPAGRIAESRLDSGTVPFEIDQRGDRECRANDHDQDADGDEPGPAAATVAAH